MRFSVISRNYPAALVLAGAAVLFAGCSETASTPGKSPTAPSKATHSSSTTRASKGREVPEAAPVSDEAASKAADEDTSGDKTEEKKPEGE